LRAIECLDEALGVLDGGCDLAMIQIRGEGDEAGFGQSRAEGSSGLSRIILGVRLARKPSICRAFQLAPQVK
jgi:hypothetical protein